MMARGYLERVVLGEERGPLSWLLRALLWPLSLAYRVGLGAYLGVYALGIRKRHRLPVPVISVGNLTFGGTGKTPAVQTICRMLREQGRSVVILSRGHGGSGKGPRIVSDGTTVLRDARECGDEPVLLARTLPGVPVVVGKDRGESGRVACREFRPDVIVLDDGLQYWQLHRDLDVVVLNAARPFGSGSVMPMGDLREARSGLRRAGVIIANDSGDGANAELGYKLGRLAPGALVLRATRVPASLSTGSGEPIGMEWLRGRRVVAFCGIGQPEGFRSTLLSLGAVLVDFVEFPDHHQFRREELDSLAARRGVAEAFVTTEKDRARLGSDMLVDDLYVLGIRLEIEGIDQLAEHIAERIDRAGKATAAEKARH